VTEAPQGQVASSQPLRFAGELYDGGFGEPKLLYLRARYYDPGTGRFMTRDPLPGVIATPRTLNRYGYTANNPTNFVDPYGLYQPTLLVRVLTAGAVAAAKIAGAATVVGTAVMVIGEMLLSPATVEAPSGAESWIAFYHGTDVATAQHLLQGGSLSTAAAAAASLGEQEPGFYLATYPGDAEYFAARQAPGSVVTFLLSQSALQTLMAAGSVFRPIARGPDSPYFQGEELVIPPSAFGIFDAERAAGRIIAFPYTFE